MLLAPPLLPIPSGLPLMPTLWSDLPGRRAPPVFPFGSMKAPGPEFVPNIPETLKGSYMAPSAAFPNAPVPVFPPMPPGPVRLPPIYLPNCPD